MGGLVLFAMSAFDAASKRLKRRKALRRATADCALPSVDQFRGRKIPERLNPSRLRSRPS